MMKTFFGLKTFRGVLRGSSRRRWACAGLALCVGALSQSATADLNIEVTEGVDVKVPIAVFPFAGEPGSMRNFSRIIMSDLSRSGLFALLPAGDDAPPQGSVVSEAQYKKWLGRGIEKAVLGRYVSEGDKGKLLFELLDTVQGRHVLAYAIEVSPERPWGAAHRAADYIYEKLTGVPGVFNTRLAFITSQRIKGKKRRFALHISDSDGRNSEEVFSTPFQIMSPTWSHDAKHIAYISYERGRPELFVQNLLTAKRFSYAEHIGQAVSPDWSPDGRYIAYASSSAGNYDIYLLDMKTLKSRRLTKSAAIDIEPSWASDGSLFFTSDRNGTPQLYRIDSTGTVRRVSEEGGYNTDADVSPEGDHIAYLSRGDDAYSIVVKNLNTSRQVRLGSGMTEEDPKFTPNGKMVSHLTTHQGRTVVGLYSIDGAHRSILPINIDNIRSIAWSPIINE